MELRTGVSTFGFPLSSPLRKVAKNFALYLSPSLFFDTKPAGAQPLSRLALRTTEVGGFTGFAREESRKEKDFLLSTFYKYYSKNFRKSQNLKPLFLERTYNTEVHSYYERTELKFSAPLGTLDSYLSQLSKNIISKILRKIKFSDGTP